MSRPNSIKTTKEWTVHVTVESRLPGIGVARIRELVSSVLSLAETDISVEGVHEIHVLLTDDERIRDLNREHRRKDKATDVLSFPQFSPAEVQGKRRVSGVGGAYLGDLVISTDTVRRQAREFEVSVYEELVRLVVHGVLHLCGYDHERVSKVEAARMRRRERSIRGQL